MAMGRLNRPSIMVYGGTIKVRSKLVLVVCLGRIHFCSCMTVMLFIAIYR